MAERINAVKTSFFGKGAIRLLGPELQKMGIRRALVFNHHINISIPIRRFHRPQHIGIVRT